MGFFGKSVRTPNKGARLPILTIGGLLVAGLALLAPGAQAQTSQPADNTRLAAQELFGQAILALETRRSISAKIGYDVDLFDHKPVGSGLYQEERSDRGLRLRLEVRFQLAGQPGSLLHVCDGQYLWMYEKLGDRESLTRIDVQRVQEALGDSGNLDKISRVGWWPGLGGLPRLLRGLHAAFDFTTLEETRLGQPPLPVWRLRGEWKPEKLAELLPDQKGNLKKGKPVDLAKLPAHLPDQVVVFLGKNDAFPYRIEYRRRESSEAAGEGGPEDRAIVTIKLHWVALNAAIHPTNFLYSPGDLSIVDGTGQFLKSLGLPP